MKNIWRRKHNNEDGSATIEAIISFTGFLFIIFTMLNVINICRAQVLISNAVDTTAKELSQYSYFYKMSGMQKFDQQLNASASNGKENINNTISTVDSLYQAIGTVESDTTQAATDVINATQAGDFDVAQVEAAYNSISRDISNVENAIGDVENAMVSVQQNPMLYMKSIAAVAGTESLDLVKSHVIAAPLAKLFMAKHFGSTTDEASEQLQKLGVVDGLEGMNFKMSTMFSSNEPENVHIVVYYKVKIVQPIQWLDLEVPLCKEAVARAWLAGDAGPTTPVASTKEEASKEEVAEEKKESYWKKDDGSDVFSAEAEKTGNFCNQLINDKNITTTETEKEIMDIVGCDDEGTVYGMTTAIDASDADNIAYLAYIAAGNDLDQIVEHDKSGAVWSYDHIKSYVYVVYLPENISDEDEKKIKEKVDADYNNYLTSDNYKKEREKADKRNISVEIVYEKAGGDYDYESDSKK